MCIYRIHHYSTIIQKASETFVWAAIFGFNIIHRTLNCLWTVKLFAYICEIPQRVNLNIYTICAQSYHMYTYAMQIHHFNHMLWFYGSIDGFQFDWGFNGILQIGQHKFSYHRWFSEFGIRMELKFCRHFEVRFKLIAIKAPGSR